MFLEVGLVFRDHPGGPKDLKGPGGSDEKEHGEFDEGFLKKEADGIVDGENDDGPEGDEVGGEGDEDVRLIREDVAAIEADLEIADSSETEVDEHGVGHLMAEDVEVEVEILADPGDKPAEHEDGADREVEEFGRVPESG